MDFKRLQEEVNLILILNTNGSFKVSKYSKTRDDILLGHIMSTYKITYTLEQIIYVYKI